MIELFRVCKSFGVKDLFRDMNLVIPKNTTAGIVGENGSGKSTLLQMIVGESLCDSGEIRLHKPNILFAYMRQEILVKEISVRDYLSQETGLFLLEQELRGLEQNLHAGNLMRYGELLEEYEKKGGYEFESKLEKILLGIGLEFSIERNISELSSGQKSKVLLAGVLLTKADVYLFDEPTNNLDYRSIRWLQEYIHSLDSTILIISHDRDFLDAVVDRIYEIDSVKHTIIEHVGTYSDYEIYKQQQLSRVQQEYETQQEQIESLTEAIYKAKIWSKKGENLKPNKRMDSKSLGFFRDKSTMKFGQKVRALEKRIEHIDTLEKPQTQKKIKYSIDENTRREGYISLHDIHFSYSSGFALDISDILIQKGERVVILGGNGSGKSTFLNIIRGNIEKYSGELYISPGLIFGDFMQEHENLPIDKTAYEIVKKAGGYDDAMTHKILSTFQLHKDERRKPVGFLSPGQRARLLLSLFRAKNANVLILDEPTNHLDMEAIEVLEKALEEFEGMLIVVSHDRQFVDRLGFERFVHIQNGKMRELQDFEEYLELF